MVTFVDEKALLAKIVYHVKVQFAIAVDVGELCRVAPAAVVHTPPVSFLLESTVALVDEQKVGCSIGRAEPGVWHDLPVMVVAGHVHVGQAIAVHVPNRCAKPDGITGDVGLVGHILEYHFAVFVKTVS